MLKQIALALSLASVALTMVHAQEAKAPSAQAICGYKWRNSEERKADKSRDAWNKFRREKCGTGTRNKNDDMIREYLNKRGDIEPAIDDDNGVIVLEARRGRGGRGK